MAARAAFGRQRGQVRVGPPEVRRRQHQRPQRGFDRPCRFGRRHLMAGAPRSLFHFVEERCEFERLRLSGHDIDRAQQIDAQRPDRSGHRMHIARLRRLEHAPPPTPPIYALPQAVAPGRDRIGCPRRYHLHLHRHLKLKASLRCRQAAAAPPQAVLNRGRTRHIGRARKPLPIERARQVDFGVLAHRSPLRSAARTEEVAGFGKLRREAVLPPAGGAKDPAKAQPEIKPRPLGSNRNFLPITAG